MGVGAKKGRVTNRKDTKDTKERNLVGTFFVFVLLVFLWFVPLPFFAPTPVSSPPTPNPKSH